MVFMVLGVRSWAPCAALGGMYYRLHTWRHIRQPLCTYQASRKLLLLVSGMPALPDDWSVASLLVQLSFEMV